jgi:hypothetical protein
MFRTAKTLTIAGALIASSLAANSAQAAGWIVGLVDGKSIVTIDPMSRKVASKVDIKGAASILAIDVRPADGMLYGVASDGNIVTINVKTGQATMKSKLSEGIKAGVTVTVDFNPVADRMRLMGSDGTSLRVNVDDGKVTATARTSTRTATPIRQDAAGRGGRLHQLLEGHAGDHALQHRRRDRLARDSGAAE